MRTSRLVRTALLAVILSFALAGSALATVTLPITGVTVSDSYASGKYYTALVEAMEDSVGLSPAERFVKIALSQNGYTGSTSSSNYSGVASTAGKYTEYNRYLKSKYGIGSNSQQWCAAFVSWCRDAAGLSDSVMPISKNLKAGYWQTDATVGKIYWLWSEDFTQKNSVDIQKGDLLLYFPSDTGKTSITGYKDGKAVTVEFGEQPDGTVLKPCGNHYLSRTGTAHVAIVADVRTVNGTLQVKTIERRGGNKVGQSSWMNPWSKSLYNACTHIYGSGKTIPAIKAIYRPNWSAASVWSASSMDSDVPVVTSVECKNMTSTGFDLVVKATDNSAVSKIRIDVWGGGVRKYDKTFDVTNTTNYSGTFHFDWADLDASSNMTYKVYAYAEDEYGNKSTSQYVYVYSDITAPGNVSLTVSNLTNTGYDLKVIAEDGNGVAKVRTTVWSAAVNRYDKTFTVNSGVEYSDVFHFNFADLGNIANTTYRTRVYITDALGNTTDPIYTDVFADNTAPTILYAALEPVNEYGFNVRVQAKDKIDVEKVVANVSLNGETYENRLLWVGDLMEYEGTIFFGYQNDPDHPDEMQSYTVKLDVYDSAGNCSTYSIPDPLVRNDPNVMPDEYYEQEGTWAFEIVDGAAYITGLHDPNVSIETLSASMWPTTVTKNGRVYQVKGTMATDNDAVAFRSMPNLKKITGFPDCYESIMGFDGCQKLTTVIMNPKWMLSGAFADCPSLTYVEMGKKLKEFDKYAFSGCSSLKTVYYAGTWMQWYSDIYIHQYSDTYDWLADMVTCKYAVYETCTDTRTLTDCVMRFVFKNDGYADAESLYWKDATFELYDENSEFVARCEKDISSVGAECVCYLDFREDFGITVDPDKAYWVMPGITCDGHVYQSGWYGMVSPEEVYAESIILSYPSLSMTVGDQQGIFRAVYPGNATDKTVIWKSSNTSVATVSGSGVITAVGAGTATITATAKRADPYLPAAVSTCKVRVTAASSCSSCSTSYARWYRVKNTSGSLAISSIHGASTASGATKLGSIPEGAVVYVNKATGYNGLGSSSGKYGHVSYNGVSGFCAMNYLEALTGTKIPLDINGGTPPASYSTDYIFVYAYTPLNKTIVGYIPRKTGYTFAGWAADFTSGELVYDRYGHYNIGSYWEYDWQYDAVWTGKSITKLVATWEKASYTLTFDPCGGSMSKRTATVVYGTATGNAQTAIPTRAGHAFLGWYTSETGGTQVYNEIGQCSGHAAYWKETYWNYPGDVKLYAHWAPSDLTAPVISHVEVYDLDKEGFSVGCTVRDKIESVSVKIWTGMDSAELEGEFVEENVLERSADVTDDYASVRIDVPKRGEYYSVLITATDIAGSSTSYLLSEDDRIYVDGYAPEILNAEIVSLTSDGFDIACDVTDDTRVGRVQMLVWPGSEEMPEDDSWLTDEAHSAKLMDGRWVYEVDSSSYGLQAGMYQVAVRAWDVYEKESGAIVLSLVVPDAEEATALAYGTHEGHVYVMYSAGSNVGWTAVSSACKALGGHLATIESAQENAVIAAMMSRYASYDSKAWIDGRSDLYSNWSGTKPSTVKYAVMNLDGSWSGESKGNVHGFVCEFDAGILVLPQLREIRDEAFTGIDAQIVVIPETCESIGARAFADCGALKFILMPEDAAIDMADDAFEQTDAMVIAY